jgi:hypothetical protein
VDETAEVPESKRLKVDDVPLLEDEVTAMSSEVSLSEIKGGSAPPKTGGNGRSKKKLLDGGNSMFKENPYTFLRNDDPILHTCM